MAKAQAVWGIDIGHCGLKALRCKKHQDSDKLLADAFDYIEYDKILTQEEVNDPEVVGEYLRQFLSRNQVKGDRVVISVPGHKGLARFVKLPPVESKKIPDIVKFEARQQIPFDLDDVIWDFQQMPGGSEEDGFVLESEVGLFAMKREQVTKDLRPFDAANIEVDAVQLTPLALYNWVAFDQMQDLPTPEEFDPDSPPESVLVISMGTYTTDLVITNGYRVWQRSVPIGGNQFTRALTKELKQTTAKAEHIKRNASTSDNPKAIFQAMRPVFNDLVTEIQRSLNFFANIDKKAKIGRAIALGNAAKMPGLVRYLSQNLNIPIQRLEAFNALEGEGVVDAPVFKENVLTFAVCYGLCLQELTDARISTNLIPPEIVKDRKIRAKKPWAVGAAAALLVAMAANVAGHWKEYNSVRATPEVEQAEGVANNLMRTAQDLTAKFDAAKQELAKINQVGHHLVPNLERRLVWLELFKAINASLPTELTPAEVQRVNARTPAMTALAGPSGAWANEAMRLDPTIYIRSIQTTPRDLDNWRRQNARWFENQQTPTPQDDPNAGGEGGMDPAAADGESAAAGTNPGDPNAPVPGEVPNGWVITLEGYHFHNDKDDVNTGAEYLRRTLIKNLREQSITITPPGATEPVQLTLKQIGIEDPVIIDPKIVNWDYQVPNPLYDPSNPQGANVSPTYTKPIFEFTVQFAWKQTLPSERNKVEEESPEQQPIENQVAGGLE